MSSIEWIVLVYKVPSDPTKYRAAIWREIKRLGGVYLQDGVCIFPDIDDVALNVSALAEYVRQSNGTEYILLTRLSNKEQTAELIAQFQEHRNQEYKHLLDELNQLALRVESPKESTSIPLLQEDLKKLKKQIDLVKGRDYFDAPLGSKILAKYLQLRKSLTS